MRLHRLAILRQICFPLLVTTLCLLVFACFGSWLKWPAAPSTQMASVDAAPANHPNIIHYDFGVTTALDDNYGQHGIEHTFTLANRSQQDITITELKPSCICIKKSYLTDGQHNQDVIGTSDYGLFPDELKLPMTVAPGTQVKIFVSIDPLSVFPGSVFQSVDVIVQGSDKPFATLQMSGILKSGINFSAPTLDFQKVSAGKAASLSLTVTLDRRLHRSTADDMIIKALSNNSDIVVTRVSAPQSMKGIVLAPDEMQLLEPENIVEDFAADTKVVYKVTLLPQARIGVIKGSLSLVAPAYPNLILFVNARIPFAGQVAGDIAASPQQIIFGSVPFGQTATKSVSILSRISAEHLKLTCANSNLSVRLVPSKTGGVAPGYPYSYKLEVTLNPKSPAGVLEENVTLSTPALQHLVVPIAAFVAPARAAR